MHPRYQKHFQEMQRSLYSSHKTMTKPLWIFLHGAAIARRYRDRLPLPRAHIAAVGYFKEHWPRFEAEVKYYELRYEAERCRPEGADRTWAAFWLQEVSRMTQLTEAHPELYAYFRGGGTDRDEELFGQDPSIAEANAGLWASFIALGRYEQELEEIFTQLLST
jgi:RteC protein